MDQTVAIAEQIANEDIREVVLTGVNVGDFGILNGETLFDLILELDHVEGIDRYRISSIEPNEVTDGFLARVAGEDRICDHLHVPLQSGDDAVLKRMRRVVALREHPLPIGEP